MGPDRLRRRVGEILSRRRPAGWKPTGVGRDYYLHVAERIVRTAAGWVDRRGAVTDPVARGEVGQTTPRFASSGAILLSFGRARDLGDVVFRSMSYACERIRAGRAKSPDFWMRELATAQMALAGVADPADLARWRTDLGAVRPEQTYWHVSRDGTKLGTLHNWAVYSSAGEYLREVAGLRPPANRRFLWGRRYFDKYIAAQLAHFTALGMYRDPGDPITYDITTRLQLATAMAFGYDGELAGPLGELLRRGGLATLLLVSPEGFAPYGGRSSQFHFQEAILCALCELEARRHRTADARLAGAFKRQARRSALAVRRWVLEMEPLRHIKNGFAPRTRHGIDSYGQYSVYSLLASSFLGLAAVFADESIAEAPCPAELGGYVFELRPAFGKVFASCRGSYVEIDTAADPHYDATGLGRFLVDGVPMELGLGMSCPAATEHWGQPSIRAARGAPLPGSPVAIGPAWREGRGWTSLAELSTGLTHRVNVRKQTPGDVRFDVTYAHGPSGARVIERYQLGAGRLRIRSAVRIGGKPARKVRLIVPLLDTDGASRAKISTAPGAVTVRYLNAAYTVTFDPRLAASIRKTRYANRNALYRSLVLEADGGEIAVDLSLGR